jgi:hypothetical protein
MERCRSYSATGAKYVTRNAINDGVVGLTRSEMPSAIDQYTPDGRIPV